MTFTFIKVTDVAKWNSTNLYLAKLEANFWSQPFTNLNIQFNNTRWIIIVWHKHLMIKYSCTKHYIQSQTYIVSERITNFVILINCTYIEQIN